MNVVDSSQSLNHLDVWRAGSSKALKMSLTGQLRRFEQVRGMEAIASKAETLGRMAA